MLLLENKELFKNIVETASRELKIAVGFIEKDCYAITVLKELIKRNDKFVFKGGTSLSVCQNAVNRFSEDVDISYEDEIITVGTRKRIKQAFFDSIEAASLFVSNPDNIRSRRIFNRYICPYESIWNNNKDNVIVEWATQIPAFPIEIKTAQTIIGKYLVSINRTDLVEKYDLGPFAVKTMTKDRTLIDKIFAICDYHISKLVTRESRHIYDIHQLLQFVKLDNDFLALFNKVKGYRLNLEKCYSAKEGMVISDLLFQIIKDKTFYQDYENVTKILLYDGVKYEDCMNAIESIATFLKENKL